MVETPSLAAPAERLPIRPASVVADPYAGIAPLGVGERARASLLGLAIAAALILAIAIAGLLLTAAAFGYSVGELL